MESEYKVYENMMSIEIENRFLEREVRKLMRKIPRIDTEDKGLETQKLVLKKANDRLNQLKSMLENKICEISKKGTSKAIVKKKIRKNKNKDEFPTYSKRKEASDSGKEYEWLMCAYYALRFCFDENVSDFNMTTNNEIYGDFDDIQLTVQFKDKTSHTFLIQLKHKESQDRKLNLQMINSKETNDFSLWKYLRTYKAMIEMEVIESKKISYILFTNMKEDFDKIQEPFPWQITKNVSNSASDNCCLVDTSGSKKKDGYIFQFQFTKREEGSDDKKDFLQCFRLLTRQTNIHGIKSLIDKKLIEQFGCKIEFIDFMHKWWKTNFVLTKNDVIGKLAELALSPFIKTYKPLKEEENKEKENKEKTDKKEEKEKMELLKKSIKQFDMTLIKNCENCDINIIETFWAELTTNITRISKASHKYGLVHKGITDEGQLLSEEKTKTLWFLNEVPLIVEYKESGKTRIQNAIKLLGTETKKKKIILLGYNSKDEYSGWTVLENLHDLLNSNLDSNDYNKVIETFNVSLQKRQSINLKQLIGSNQEIAKLIKIEHMLIMIQEDYCIGEKSAGLPEPYIPRSIRPADSLGTPVQEKEFANSNRLLNIIVGKPGSGKSTFLSYLTSQCPSIYWCVRVNLIKYNSFLRKRPTNGEFLLELLKCEDPFSDNIVVQLKKDGRIYLLLDGLDEIDSNCLQTVFNFINYAVSSAVGIKVWLSSRENLESRIMKSIDASLDVSFWKIDELIIEEQKDYIRNRLKNHNENQTTVKYTDYEIENIINKIFNIININNNAKLVLGVPLHLYIITEILRNEKKEPESLEDVFVLSKMFRMFFKGKRKHQDQKSGLQHEEAYDIYDFEYTLQQYQIVALRACLDPITLEKLKLGESKELSDSQKFLEMIDNTGNKLGIISQVYKDEDQMYRARFFHQSFAEYFASEWFVNNAAKLQLIKEDFFSDKCQHLRLIFDITLAEDCPLQLAVLHKNPEEVEKYIIQNPTQKDRQCRNVFHLSFSYCEDSLNLRNEQKAVLDLRILRSLLKNISLDILDETDQLFQLNCFDYAVITQSLFPFEVIAEIYGESVLVYIQYLFKHFENAKLLDCCSRLGYSFLLEAFFREKESHRIKLKRDLILQAAVQVTESKEEYFKAKCRKTIQTLTHNGCDVNERDDDGSTLLHIFCQKGDIKKVKALLNYCTNIDLFVINNYEKKTALHFASESHNTELVEMLIEKGLNVNDLDEDNWTPLHYGCRRGSCEVVKTILEHNADINAITNQNETMLHLAAVNSKPEIITFLINEGMQVNQVAINDYTPLHIACEFGSCEIIKTLLEHNADINAVTNENVTMLHLAATNSKPEIITFLINEGMQVYQVNINNFTPLHYACRFGSCEIVKTLLEHNADINAVTNKNETMLHLAAMNSKPEIITFLINEGMQVNQVAINDYTPLHIACEFGSCEIIKTLLEHNADINAITNENATMLHLAAINSKPEIITFLINEGMQVNQVNINNSTPLHYACRYGSCEIIKTLLEHNADINAVTNQNATMLHAAAINSKPEIITFLINEGMQVNQVDVNDWTPLHIACRFGSCEIVKTLLEHNADINAVTNVNETMLHAAAINSKPEIITFLINEGMQVNQVNINNSTPLHYACVVGSCEIIKTLLEHNADINAVTNKNETMLHLAAINSKPEVITFLINEGMQVNQVNINNSTPLHYACVVGSCEIIKTLLEHNADINAVTNKNETMLHLAAINSKPEVITFLINEGMQVNQVNIIDWSPLHYACSNGSCEVIKTFIKHKANINAVTKYGETMLHLAIINENIDVLEFLLAEGAPINVFDKANQTPLYCACMDLNYRVVEILLKKGADLDSSSQENLIRNFHKILLDGNVYTVKSLLTKMKEKRIDIEDVPPDFPLHLAKKQGQLQPTLLLKMTRHINEFRLSNGSSTVSDSELYKYLTEKFQYVSPQEMQELRSTLYG